MKKKYLTPILLSLLLSCSEDKEAGNSNYAAFYGETYALEQGAIYHDNNHTVLAVEDYVFEAHYGTQTDSVKGYMADIKKKQTGNFLLGLYEEGFVVSDLTKDARGTGACICLRLASPETGKLAAGKYVYSPNREEYTFKGYSSVNYSPKGSTTPNELTEGEVDIAQKGEMYSIRFKCKTSFGAPVEGEYVGKMKWIDIRKEAETMNFYENIKLEALFDEVNYTDLEGEQHSEPDYQRATSFLLSSTQQVYSANLYKGLAESIKKGIDIALAYDKENKAIYFESPIKMRALLWHNTYVSETLFDYSFDLPCHTRYMSAPADFTDADFEALTKQEDFLFDFSEQKVALPVADTRLPYFVVVQTGNGLQGVIRIREITPQSTEMIAGITYPVNPCIVMDLKFPRNYSEQQLR